jgi:hypothetical protein
MEKFEGAKPLQSLSSPSPLKERGTKGVRLKNTRQLYPRYKYAGMSSKRTPIFPKYIMLYC